MTQLYKKKKKSNLFNSSLKLLRRKKRAYISCGKDSEKYRKLFAIVTKDVFTIANTSVYSNAFQYFGAIKACKKFASTIIKKRKTLLILQTSRL